MHLRLRVEADRRFNIGHASVDSVFDLDALHAPR
jgi:hypothetical protein